MLVAYRRWHDAPSTSIPRWAGSEVSAHTMRSRRFARRFGRGACRDAAVVASYPRRNHGVGGRRPLLQEGSSARRVAQGAGRCAHYVLDVGVAGIAVPSASGGNGQDAPLPRPRSPRRTTRTDEGGTAVQHRDSSPSGRRGTAGPAHLRGRGPLLRQPGPDGGADVRRTAVIASAVAVIVAVASMGLVWTKLASDEDVQPTGPAPTTTTSTATGRDHGVHPLSPRQDCRQTRSCRSTWRVAHGFERNPNRHRTPYRPGIWSWWRANRPGRSRSRSHDHRGRARRATDTVVFFIHDRVATDAESLARWIADRPSLRTSDAVRRTTVGGARLLVLQRRASQREGRSAGAVRPNRSLFPARHGRWSADAADRAWPGHARALHVRRPRLRGHGPGPGPDLRWPALNPPQPAARRHDPLRRLTARVWPASPHRVILSLSATGTTLDLVSLT